MGKSKPNQILWYALHRFDHYSNTMGRFEYDTMAVTSVKKSPHTGVVMVHGHRITNKQSCHWKIDKVDNWYQSLEAMENALHWAEVEYLMQTNFVNQTQELLATAIRHRKIQVERQLNKHSIQPEFEHMED